MKNVQNFDPNFDTTPVGAPPFQTGRFCQNSKKTCQVMMAGVPHDTSQVGVGPPNFEIRWRTWGPKG